MSYIFLQATNSNAGYMQLLMIALMILIFWLFIIRPNSKRQKEIQKQRDSLQVNDKVIISDGIMGTLKQVNKEQGFVMVEIADGVRVKVSFQNVFPLVTEEPKKK